MVPQHHVHRLSVKDADSAFSLLFPYMLHHLLQKCSFFLIKLAALAAGGWAKQRTAEYRISNRRIMKDGIAALCLLN
jgi:hypothetical protein